MSKQIGIISDTHGYLDPRVFEYFKDCDEVWHAGDIGTLGLIQELEKFKPIRAVYGNIDSHDIRYTCPEYHEFELEGVKIIMTHIAGKPGSYNPALRQKILQTRPAILVCGHSHIAKVQRDPKFAPLLYINPGAAGNHGFHKIKTIMRMELDAGKISKLEVVELGNRG